MRKKRWNRITAAVLVLGLSLGGCSPASGEPSSDAPQTVISSISESTARESAGSEKASEKESPASHTASKASKPKSSKPAEPPKPVVKSIRSAQLTLSKDVFDYTGKEILLSGEDEKASLTVRLEGNRLYPDKDYTVSYENNTEPGHRTAKVVVTGKGSYSGKAEAAFTILPRQITDVQVSGNKGFVDVSWGSVPEAEGYRVLYSTKKDFSSGFHELLVTDGNSVEITEGYTGGDTVYAKVCAYYAEGIEQLCGPDSETESVKVQGALGTLVLSADSWYYSGGEIAPDCKVYSTQNEELTLGKDYTLRYANNVRAGRATVTAEGTGNYSGTVSEPFDICPGKNELTILHSESGVVELGWKADPIAEGYYLLCSQFPDFHSYYYLDYDKEKTSALVETYSLGEGTWYFKISSYVLGKNSEDDRIGVYSDAKSVMVEAPKPPEEFGTPQNSQTSETSQSEPDDDVQKQLAPLEAALKQTVSGYNGIWCVYVKNLRTGESISINNRRLYTASEMKLFGMTAAYQAIEDGRISEDSLKGLLNDMITVSDNDAFNQIVRKIGVTSVRDWIVANGYTDTYQCAGFVSGNNYWETVIGKGYNYSSVNDCGRLLESIYKGECVSEKASAKMLDLLKRQQLTSKIPSVIPAGIPTANKTGEYLGTNHDCAIIFLEGNPYILCVFSETDGYYLQYSDRIRHISSVVYQFMASL